MPNPTYDKPNRAASVSGVALKGRRTQIVNHGSYSQAPERSEGNVNAKSSNNTNNYSAPNQSRSGR